ncbi:MAG: hypothetical protein HFI05_01780 [Lachnospiraceae bacterium]|jgi:hypothetical protein|nr:hypothetical protein [Lachnospiraceae bacterium]
MKQQDNKMKIFENNISTFKETSIDNDDGKEKYMIESEIKVINFDAVKKEYMKDMGVSEVPCSIDALYTNDNENYYFIEFKNGIVKPKIYNIYNKIYDSLLIFNDITNSTISFCRKNVRFILVYNEEKNNQVIDKENSSIQATPSKNKIAKSFSNKAKKKFIMFGLEKFEKLYFKEVFTYTEKEFENEFLEKISDKT